MRKKETRETDIEKKEEIDEILCYASFEVVAFVACQSYVVGDLSFKSHRVGYMFGRVDKNRNEWRRGSLQSDRGDGDNVEDGVEDGDGDVE
eukprot:263482-Hanusia_phi.AAC.1